jgi:NAD(P)-dependent dehydrogenase (short-subunit alcohol dehydrogenase family)
MMTRNLFDLTGKTALVTGGNGGIGLGIAAGLAQAGANVVIWGRSAAKNAHAVEALSHFKAPVTAQQVDVSDEDAVTEAFAQALEATGRIDFVCANAGGGGTQSFVGLSTEDWRQTVTVNLDSVFWLFRAACRHMRERHASGDSGGSLAVVASVAAINSPARGQAYAASKAGAVALTRSVAAEHGAYGIRANAILPGFVRSDLSAHLQAMDKFTEQVIDNRVATRRWGEPGDFAGIAVYLASDLSSFHTADTIVIDGGFSNS